MRVIGGCVLAAIVLVGAACDDERRSPTAADLDQIDLRPDHALTVDEDGFSPQRLSVRVDDVIEVTNDGTRAHTITASDTGDGVAFDARLQPGETLTLIVPDTAPVDYSDREATDHRGRLDIQPAA